MRSWLIALFIISVSVTFAQDDYDTYAGYGLARKHSLGVWGHFNLNLHSANFQELPGVPSCCPVYKSGSGIGFSAGFLYEAPLGDKWYFDIRPGYFLLSGALIAQEEEIVNFNGQAVNGVFEHTINSYLGAAGLEHLISYRIGEGFAVGAGYTLGYVVPGTYTTYEKVISPEGAFTPDGNNLRLYSDGDIPNVNRIFAGFTARLSYEFPINSDKTMWLAPEFTFTNGLSTVVNNLDWGVAAFRFGAALKISPPYRMYLKVEPKEKKLEIIEYNLCGGSTTFYINPDSVKFFIDFHSEIGVEGYGFKITNGGEILDKADFKYQNVPEEIVWQPPPDMPEILYGYPDTSYLVFYVADEAGQYITDSSRIVAVKNKMSLTAGAGLEAIDTAGPLNIFTMETMKTGGAISAGGIYPERFKMILESTTYKGVKDWKAYFESDNRILFDTSGNGTHPESLELSSERVFELLPTGFGGDVKYTFEITDSLGNSCFSEGILIFEKNEYGLIVDYETYGKYTDIKKGSSYYKKGPALRIEERISTRLQPLLNYVFFDENSSELPPRYNRLSHVEAGKFNIDGLHDSPTLETYRHLLNIIGRRLLEKPSANISLTGCNCNTGSEKGNLGLSQNRAETVRDYLIQAWDIDQSRIVMNSPRNLPSQPSTTNPNFPEDMKDGIEENRRVEIHSDDPDILKPVLTYGKRYKTVPGIFLFVPEVISPLGIDSWHFSLSAKGAVIDSFPGKDFVPDSVFWRPNNSRLGFLRDGDIINTAMKVKNPPGLVAGAKGIIPVEKISLSEGQGQDTTYDEYSLILFDFASNRIGGHNQEIIEIIKERVNPGAIIHIIGQTDRVGKEEYNQRLSSRRAMSAKKGLGFSGEYTVHYRGVGESELLYDNTHPEGRFYCRTVLIEVANPIIR